MKTTIKGIMTAAAFAAITACGDAAPTAPAALLPETTARIVAKPQLSFSNQQSYSEQQAFTATGGEGQISFTGSMTTGTPCYEVTGAAQSAGGTVTLTVSASSTGGSCIQVVTFNNYAGAVSRLAAGSYTFQVVHEGGGSQQTVSTQQVTVS